MTEVTRERVVTGEPQARHTSLGLPSSSSTRVGSTTGPTTSSWGLDSSWRKQEYTSVERVHWTTVSRLSLLKALKLEGRHRYAAVGLAVTVLALSFVEADEDLAAQLLAERSTSSLLSSMSVGQEELAVVWRGDPHPGCRRGVDNALERGRRRRARVQETGRRAVELECRVFDGELLLTGHLLDSEATEAHQRAPLPTFASVVPPILAVFLALATRRLVFALASAVWLGAILAHGSFEPTLGLWPALSRFVWPSVSDQFRITIVVFASALVGIVNVATRAGGSQGIADAVSRLARGARSTRLATALLGLAIFFDDYANCIVVGTTMRPLADRMRISREKLAYLVDSTAAPVAGLALLSTWIGYEVSLFDDLSRELSLGVGGYDIFLQVLPLRFYCLLTLAFVFVGAFTGRDFGPMARAEERAFRTGKVLADDARPLTSRSLSQVMPAHGVVPRWQVAMVPVAVVIVATGVGLILSGGSSDEVSAWLAAGGSGSGTSAFLRQCLQAADSPFVLMIAALAGSLD